MANDSNLIARMRSTPILVAKKKDKMRAFLASATEIYINDDIIYQQIFNLLTAPENDILETFYKVYNLTIFYNNLLQISIIGLV